MQNVIPRRKKTIRDIEVRGKRVLVRADFNVPLNDDAPSPTIPVSGPACRRSATSASRMHGSSSAPTWTGRREWW
nr:phosphoglycerate kinase [Methanoculleus bourgensis]